MKTTSSNPYGWLGADTAEVLAWEREQVGLAAEAIGGLPGVAVLARQLEPHLRRSLTDMLGGATRVAGCWYRLGPGDGGADGDGDGADGEGQAIRVSRSPDDPGRVLIDAAELGRLCGEQETPALVYLDPAPDGSTVAVTYGPSGRPFGTCSVLDAHTGRPLGVTVDTMVGNAIRPGWLPDGSGFYLHGRTAGSGHQMRFRPIRGEPDEPGATDEALDVTLDQVPSTALALVPQVSPSGRHVVAVTVPHQHVAAAVGTLPRGQRREGERLWRRFVPEGFEGELYGDWLDADTYVAIATDEPRGRVVAIPAATSTDPATWHELVPAGAPVLRSLTVIAGRLVVAALLDVSLDIRVYLADGTPVGTVPLPPASASIMLTGPARIGPPTDAMVFCAESFAVAQTRYLLDEDSAEVRELSAGGRLDGVSTTQHFATSADGTRIPYYVVAREPADSAGTAGAAGPRPALVTAYGGFNFPWLPSFLGEYAPFLDAGGVYVHANLRGGSEYGRRWYEAGRRERKRNVFDDLRAVAEDLLDQGIAAPGALAFHGRSNGGLLAAVAAVRQPELWRVVVPEVPVLDVLRPVADGPGAGAIRAVYAEDYGDPEDPALAPVLRSYSPCQNVRPGTAYPAVFTIVGRHDIACPPSAARRFVAALRDATTSGLPVHLQVVEEMGHGSLDPPLAARIQAEWLAFVLDQLGLPVPAGTAG